MIRLFHSPQAPAYMFGPEVQRLASVVAQSRRNKSAQDIRQERTSFGLFTEDLFREVTADLKALSHGKCAYCETPFRNPKDSLDRFRPKGGALGLKGDYSPDHYWWLAYDWANIYPSCSICNKLKGPKFPVEGARAPVGTPLSAIQEQRLLVDPFADNPMVDLDFLDNGNVIPRSKAGDVTIATFELNRPDLVEARRDVAAKTQHRLRTASVKPEIARAAARELLEFRVPQANVEMQQASSPAPPERVVRALMAAEADYAAAARAVIFRHAGVDPVKAARESMRAAGAPAKSAKARKTSKAQTKTLTVSERSGLRSNLVSAVEIRNFRGVEKLKLDIPYDRADLAPWAIMVGENGTGKSTILQAIALALAEPSHAKKIGISPAAVLRIGESAGWVKLWLTGRTEPRVMEFSKKLKDFRYSGPKLEKVLLGYGATRLLPRKKTSSKHGAVRLENMFDPFRPLLDADDWLLSLDPRSFDYVARSLKDVLGLPASSKMVRHRGRNGKVKLSLWKTNLNLDQLSDGYQSVLGLVCDLMAGLRSSSRGALEVGEGVVAIDELGAHLHPRWRMRVVERLRKAFPRVQFLVSTHDPLCLRGLDDGEAVVLRRTSHGRIFVVPDLPPIKGLRVDQILTSEYFGLDSTTDPSIEEKFRQLYRLLALRKPRPQDEEKIKSLREELKPFEVPGTTRRERRLLEIIDKQLAEEDEEPDPNKRKAIAAESQRRVTEDLNKLLREPVAT